MSDAISPTADAGGVLPTAGMSLRELYQQLPPKEAADFLKVTPRYLEAKRHHGGGPKYIRLAKNRVRYRLKELIEFQEERLREHTAQEAAE